MAAVPNPVGPGSPAAAAAAAGGGSRADRIATMSHATPAARPAGGDGVVDVVSSKAKVAAAAATTTLRTVRWAFLDKPWQTSALAAAWVGWLFTLCSTWASWVIFKGSGSVDTGQSVVDFTYNIVVSTTDVKACENGETTGTAAQRFYENSATCTQVALTDIAPALKWWYSAGATSLALLILGVFVGLPGAYLTVLRRQGTLDAVVPKRWALLTSHWVTVALHATAALLALIAFASYAGALSSSFNALALRAAFNVGVTVDEDGVLTPFPGMQINLAPAYGAGFVLAIVAFLAFAAAAVLVALFPTEASRVPADGAATAAALAVDTLGAVVYPSVAAIAPPGGAAGTGAGGAYGNDDGVGRQQVYAPEGAPPAFPPSTPPPHQALPYQLPPQQQQVQGGSGGATVSPNPLQRVAPGAWGAGATDAAAPHVASAHESHHHARAAFPPQPESAVAHAGSADAAGAVPPAVPPRSRPPPVPAASFATVGGAPPATPQRQLHVSYVPQQQQPSYAGGNGLDSDAGAMPPPAPTYDAAGGSDGHQPTI